MTGGALSSPRAARDGGDAPPKTGSPSTERYRSVALFLGAWVVPPITILTLAACTWAAFSLPIGVPVQELVPPLATSNVFLHRLEAAFPRLPALVEVYVQHAPVPGGQEAIGSAVWVAGTPAMERAVLKAAAEAQVYIHICIYIYIYIHIHIYLYQHTHTHTYIHPPTHIYIYTHAHIYIYICV